MKQIEGTLTQEEYDEINSRIFVLEMEQRVEGKDHSAEIARLREQIGAVDADKD